MSESQMKEKYLLTLTDDRSNYVWTFPLKTKDEAEETIKAWILEMERQHEGKIKVLRSEQRR
jgi:hypothetical protein